MEPIVPNAAPTLNRCDVRKADIGAAAANGGKVRRADIGSPSFGALAANGSFVR